MKNVNNKFSKILTQNSSYPGSKAMFYATGFKNNDFKKSQIGIVSNWYEGNPCNMHLNSLGNEIKLSVKNEGLIGFQFNTIGISDGITMGTSGMRYSLPSRDLIADSIESVISAHYHDGVIAIPGCDKNIPGALMALIRLNRPSIIVYGGSISSGFYKNKKLSLISCLEALGEKNSNKISNKDYQNIIKNSCPGAGACGGMYTANTMAIALETMGMTLPYSSSYPATSSSKNQECLKIGKTIKKLLKLDIKPKDIITKKSLKNAISVCVFLGGSTNLVLHLLAIAKTAKIDISLKDFKNFSENIPLIGNLKPSGEFLMEDIHNIIGGTPVILKYLLNEGFIEGDCITVTGKTLSENLKNTSNLSFNNQKIIYPINNPIKNNGHIRILYGNIAPDGAVAKITGKEGVIFSGPAKTFDSEEEANQAIMNKYIKSGDVIVIRYVGPKGAPGMPEMLKPTSYIMGSGIGKKIALITDGRFSGGSHGFVVGHITPEAQLGGPIALIENGDIITIDTNKDILKLNVDNDELKNRKNKWTPPELKEKSGYLYKYYKTVSSASEGCVTDQL